MLTKVRPQAHECNDYFKRYVRQVESDDFLQVLKDEQTATTAFLQNLTLDQWDYAYAPDKWTIKEVFIHLIDTERIFAYRALCIARNDKTPLPGFEQDDYIPFANAATRSPESIIAEYNTVRAASIELFQSFDEAALQRIGTASDHSISTLAIGFIIAGHEQHHMRILRERYL